MEYFLEKCCSEVKELARSFMDRDTEKTNDEKTCYIEAAVSLHACTHYISKNCMSEFMKEPDYLKVKHFGDFWKLYIK